jgi:hypothetical protein
MKEELQRRAAAHGQNPSLLVQEDLGPVVAEAFEVVEAEA